MSRWDHLFELKPKPLAVHVVEEVARLIAQDLSQWPPPVVEWSTEADRRKYSALFSANAVRPGPETLREAFKLARWEMQRDVQAIDDYMTEERWRTAGVSDDDFLALLFLHQWLVEQMLALSEATEGRVRRPQLESCLVLAERSLAEGERQRHQ